MSQQAESGQSVDFRAGTSADWPSIEAIANATNDGSFSLFQARWDRWAGDTNARLIVMSQGDRVVGFARLSELGPAEWWMEGLKFAPDAQGTGLEKALVARLIETFSDIGIGLLRFATSAKDDEITRLVPEFGFRRIISFKPMHAKSAPGDYHKFKLLQLANLEMAHQYLRRSPMSRVNHFEERDSTFYYMTQERLHQFLSGKDVQVLGWRQGDQVHGLAVIHLPDDGGTSRPMQIGLIDSRDDTTFSAMLTALRGIALKRNFAEVHWMMPLSIGLERPVAATDLTPSWDGELCLYERPLMLPPT